MESSCPGSQNSTSNSTHDGIHRGQTQASPSSAEKDWALKSELRGAFDKEWVSCPVCGRSIRGIDYNVNSHLGTFWFDLIFLQSSEKFLMCEV